MHPSRGGLALLMVLAGLPPMLHAIHHGQREQGAGSLEVMVIPGESVQDRALPHARASIDLFEPSDDWKEIGPDQQLPGVSIPSLSISYMRTSSNLTILRCC
ncbi:hypothetical protein H257_15168 [Aphanomyces astaci]|uniref:Uncharacterized protein n=1 Tax=Aphanomyces astaci TaxID=112090 RepID=W4FPY5_APHAT|nr:hypothetical protein H257_15168 [Aphanomyces astaci]ETV69016.1 hypothetical protein H257_15168 [Aphanomyces astaci]|eukprot:XP_009841475.1 hypothetical protein H257_15168 [Aphanomyces astaci]